MSKFILKGKKIIQISSVYKSVIFECKTPVELPRWKKLNTKDFKFGEFSFDVFLYKPVMLKSANGDKHRYILGKLNFHDLTLSSFNGTNSPFTKSIEAAF